MFIVKIPICRVAVARPTPGIFLDCVETSHRMITRQRPAGRDLHHHAAAQLEKHQRHRADKKFCRYRGRKMDRAPQRVRGLTCEESNAGIRRILEA